MQVLMCDIPECGSQSAQTYEVQIPTGSSRSVDLCAAHAASLLTAYEVGRAAPRISYSPSTYPLMPQTWDQPLQITCTNVTEDVGEAVTRHLRDLSAIHSLT